MGCDGYGSQGTQDALIAERVGGGFRYGTIGVATATLGMVGMVVFFVWPRAPIDPGGVPTVVLAAVVQIRIAFFVLLGLCLASFVASLVSLTRRERFRGVALTVASVNALVLAILARAIALFFHTGL